MKIEMTKYPSPRGEITLVRMENASGASVVLSSLGAGIVEVNVPDRHGKIENVALRYANPADYIADGPCMGKVPGRYANRIAKGHFEIDGTAAHLAINNGPNALHGGPEGFQNRIWHVETTEDGRVRFSYDSADGEEGYPGEVKAWAEYRFSDSNVLELTLEATSTAPTVVNLTNHAYWNLDGADAGSVLGHSLSLNAPDYLPTDDTLIPTGEILPVDGTPNDFRTPKELGRDIHEPFPGLIFGKGYDACWRLAAPADDGLVRNAAVLASEKSGRVLRVHTDQPGMQVYTGNWLDGSPLNCSGRSYRDYEGVALEAQGFPDAPNRPLFPSQALRPGELYSRRIIFDFEA